MKMSEEVMDVIKTIRKHKEAGELKNLLKIHQELIFELNNRLTKIEQQQEQNTTNRMKTYVDENMENFNVLYTGDCE